ncbi:MAG: LysM peptidoglycan-binding domain-containing protein [Deltaproteobacteria bacterium]|jgi:membrane-bound lytic murein transglycosylase D|nr:LysM peptidoglycan-binding domain-containing protein [Deltaproteobacteria bacterium]
MENMRSIHKFKEICFSILAFLILTFFILTVPSYASKSKSNKKKYTGSFLNIRFTTSKLNKNKISGKNGAAQVVIVSSANTNNSSQDNKVFIKKIKPKKHETAKKTAVVAAASIKPINLSDGLAASGLLAKKGDFANYQKNMTHIFPMIINKEIIHYIHYYQTTGRDFFKYALSRSEKYIPMIKKIFQKIGLPNDLAYLAMIESGFSPTAYSYAGASGMWQFIPSTGRIFGLTINWWVDERRNPVESTYAAAEYLKDLFNKFGSWYLAAAAYNAGELTIERALSVDPGGNFWSISQNRPYLLPGQTRRYVPKIIAAAIIAKDPANFGFHNINYQKPIKFKQVKVPYSVSLYDLAKCIGVSEYELQKMNPELLRNVTPPDDPGFMLNIPASDYGKFLKNFKNLKRYVPKRPVIQYTAYSRPANNTVYTVEPGDTLMGIASKYGASLAAIERYNGLNGYSILKVGEKITIPGINAANTNYAANNSGSNTVYTVEPGDTLMGIASKYGASLAAIERYNGLNGYSILKVGEKITIPGGKGPQKTIAQNTFGDATLSYIIVKPGMTLWSISQKFNVSINYIKDINRINGNDIHTGEKIFLKGGSNNSVRYSYIKSGGNNYGSKRTNSGFLYYRVKFGDSLYGISAKFHDNVKNIMAENNIKNPNSIYPGELLKITK